MASANRQPEVTVVTTNNGAYGGQQMAYQQPGQQMAYQQPGQQMAYQQPGQQMAYQQPQVQAYPDMAQQPTQVAYGAI